MKSLIQDIKKKKELSAISDKFVKDHLINYFKQNPKIKTKLEKSLNPKSAVYKKVVKEIRAKLRRVYGLFREDNTKQQLELIKTLKGRNLALRILETHSSTKERLPIYEKLYHNIFQITGEPKTLLDLGSGINPFSYIFMKVKNLNYHTFDLSNHEVSLINIFFKQQSINGTAKVLDLLELKESKNTKKTGASKKLPEADVAFLFKMTDALDQGKGHKTTEIILTKIPAKFVVVSFATKTMSGKKMTAPRRSWMEWLCKRVGYTYKILEFTNEIFYVIRK